MRISLIYILLIISVIFSKAQSIKDNLITEANAGYGFLFAHHSFFNYFTESHPYLFNLRVSKQMKGNKDWHRIYRYPRVGLGLHFCDFGNKQYLGNSKSFYGFINIPITTNNICSWNYTIGAGFSWLSKYFDIEQNHYNIAIGSPGNVYFNLATDFRYQLNKKFELYSELSITHYSNGSVAKPNTGINIVTLNVGTLYKINPTEKIVGDKKAFVKRNEFSLIYGVGIHEKDPPVGTKYFISTLSLGFKRQFWRKRNLGMVLDIMYDESLIHRLKMDSLLQSSSFPNYKIGIALTHDFIVGNTSITMQTGSYIFQDYKKDGDIYSKFGIIQRIKEHFILSVALKTHFFKADYVEWGIGYIIY